MDPFYWIQWSPMVIAIGTNGGRHWCQWRWGAPLVPLGPSPLAPMDRHWHHLLSPMAPMVRIPNRYDPFAIKFIENRHNTKLIMFRIDRTFKIIFSRPMRIVNLEIVNNCEQLWTFVKKNHCEFEKKFWKIHKSSQKFTIFQTNFFPFNNDNCDLIDIEYQLL